MLPRPFATDAALANSENDAWSDRECAFPLVFSDAAAHLKTIGWHSRSESAKPKPNIETGRRSMRFRPLQDRVLIRSVKPQAKTAGGIIIPDTGQEKPVEGEVVAVGPGARDADGVLHALDVRAGDRVLFGKWSGSEVKLDGEDLMIMKETDILGVIKQNAAKKQAA